MSEFDAKAKEWDLNPVHLERTKAIAAEIIRQVPLNSSMTALEYGAGTGLLSLELREKLGKITLMDNSAEMNRMVGEKVKREGINTFEVVLYNLEEKPYDGRFDLIFTQMVLHHVADIRAILGKFNEMLNPGGYLAIADLYTEDGSFHDSSFTGHKGFDVNELTRQSEEQGFHKISTTPVYTIRRINENGSTAAFPIFLLLAEKKA